MPSRFMPPRLSSTHATLNETLEVLGASPRLPAPMPIPQSTRRRLLAAAGGALLLSPLPALPCVLIPSETGGPYPGDGTNGPNVLTQTGIVRSDIRASFGSAGAAVAAGTTLTVTLQLVSTVGNTCTPVVGAAVYLWHCDAQGRYSLYSSGATTQNYLRGVQVSDANGRVTFTTIFPGAYSGRWPHIHFEVYSSVARAVSGANATVTSQLALPDDICRAVFAQTTLYPGSLANHNQTTLANDNVFANDRAVYQLATTTGNNTAGYVATLEVGVPLAGSAAPVAPDINQQGLTGMWYEPASSGQGLALEVYPDLGGAGIGYLHAGWFTFDVAPAGGIDKQRWYAFSGAINGNASTATLPIYRVNAGNFNAAPVVTGVAVGTAVVSFSSCSSGSLQYTFSDGSNRVGTIPLTRLISNVTCSTTSARPTHADFAYSGNWYNPATSGQGFIIEVNPIAPVVFFCWYTFAANGQALGESGLRWFTGQGVYTPGSRQAAVTLYEVTGGIFDTDTAATQSASAVGAATLTFQNCGAATLAFAFTGGSNAGRSGTIALSRTGPAPAGCA